MFVLIGVRCVLLLFSCFASLVHFPIPHPRSDCMMSVCLCPSCISSVILKSDLYPSMLRTCLPFRSPSFLLDQFVLCLVCCQHAQASSSWQYEWYVGETDLPTHLCQTYLKKPTHTSFSHDEYCCFPPRLGFHPEL